jgi:uncharacterized iron-regulated membrane protein
MHNSESHSLKYRTVWRWHFYAGMFCIPFVLILSVTGGIYLFKQEIEDWSESAYNHLELKGEAVAPSQLVQHVLKDHPDASFSSYQLPPTSSVAPRMLIRTATGQQRVYIHPVTQQELLIYPEQERFMRYMFRIHGELMLGDRGSMLVELASSWTIILILTGLFLWWPRSTLRLNGVFLPRLNKQGRLFWRDLHVTTGFWISFFVLFLLISGLPWSKFWGDYFKQIRSLTGTAVARQDWSNGNESERTKATSKPKASKSNASSDEHAGHQGHASNKPAASKSPPLDLTGFDRAVEVASTLSLPHPVLISPLKEQAGVWKVQSMTANRPLRTTLNIDGKTGEILQRQVFKDKHWIDKAVSYGIAAHEGRLFGSLNQLLGLFTALGLITMCTTAIIMWWKRRQPGTIGLPIRETELHLPTSFYFIIICLGLCLPLFGISFLILWIIDRLFLQPRETPIAKTIQEPVKIGES